MPSKRKKMKTYDKAVIALRNIELPDPVDLVKMSFAKIPREFKFALLVSLCISLIVHLYLITTVFVNEDTILRFTTDFGIRNLAVTGRWFHQYFTSLSSLFQIPWVIGLFALFYLSLGVSFIIITLDIKSKTYISLISLVVVSFPTWSNMFSYMFSADLFAGSFLLSVLAVFFAKKYKYGCVVGAFCLMLSLSLYQAMIGYTIGLVLLILILEIFKKSKFTVDMLYIFVRYAVMGIMGLILYILSIRISLYLLDLQMSTYRGLDNMGQISVSQIPYLAHRTYEGFFAYFLSQRFVFSFSNTMIRLHITSFILCFILGCFIYIKSKLYKSIANTLLLVICVIALPIALNIIDFVNPAYRASDLNIVQFTVVFITLLTLCENVSLAEFQKKGLRNAAQLLKYASIVCVFLIGTGYWQQTGQHYYVFHIYNQRTFAFYNRVLARIETVEGYRSSLPVAFIGGGQDGMNNRIMNFSRSAHTYHPSMHTQALWHATFPFVGYVSPLKNQRFISRFLGVELDLATPAQRSAIMENDEFLRMPAWPAQDSVRIIDDVIVVKLSYFPAIIIEQVDGLTYRFESTLQNLPGDYLFAWYVWDLQLGGRDTIWFDFDQHILYYEFNSPGQFQIEMFVRDSHNRGFVHTRTGTITVD